MHFKNRLVILELLRGTEGLTIISTTTLCSSTLFKAYLNLMQKFRTPISNLSTMCHSEACLNLIKLLQPAYWFVTSEILVWMPFTFRRVVRGFLELIESLVYFLQSVDIFSYTVISWGTRCWSSVEWIRGHTVGVSTSVITRCWAGRCPTWKT